MNNWLEIGTNLVHVTASISDGVKLGENNIIYAGAVIGLRGFQRGNDDTEGAVIIGNNNRIGAHSCIMHNVIIGDNNLIMNLVNIGHDSLIGNNNEIGASTTICGFVEIGNDNKIKVACNIRNRKKIGNKCLIGMGANVVSDIKSNSEVKGNPAK